MFNSISWQSYWTTLACVLVIYYIVVYFSYYSGRLKGWIFGKLNDKSQRLASAILTVIKDNDETITEVQQASLFEDETFQLPSDESKEYVVYNCVDELNALLEECRRTKCIKEELIYSLQRLLKKYQSIHTSEYKESLSNVIVTQCEKICSIHLNAEEMKQVWTGK